MQAFLVGLLQTPSPTGYHPEAIQYTEDALRALALPGATLTRTPKEALLLHWPGQASDAPRGLTAHVDTLGLMVKEIKSSGRLVVTMLGGFDWGAVEGEGVTIRTADDQRYRGTVLPTNPSVHVNRELRTQKRDQQHMEIRIDARTNSADDTRALGIQVGDFVFLDPRVEVSETGFIRSRHLDDKASVASIWGALDALKQAGQRPAQETYILIANYEEVGHGGSAGLPDTLEELIAVDMAAIGPGQSSDEFSVSLCVKDAGGPYHLRLNDKLRRLATAHSIDLKPDIYPYYGSDGTAYWRAGGAARVALVGPGVDASHHYERTHQDSLTETARLLAQYLLDDDA